jgi:hypothetical protein
MHTAYALQARWRLRDACMSCACAAPLQVSANSPHCLAECVDNEDGTFKLTWKGTVSGTYSLSVTLSASRSLHPNEAPSCHHSMPHRATSVGRACHRLTLAR